VLRTSTEVELRWVPLPARRDHVAVRWYLRYDLSYRDVEELLVERGIQVDHVSIFRWVQRFTPRHCCIERSGHPK
jgi:transposase-like protein